MIHKRRIKGKTSSREIKRLLKKNKLPISNPSDVWLNRNQTKSTALRERVIEQSFFGCRHVLQAFAPQEVGKRGGEKFYPSFDFAVFPLAELHPQTLN